MARTALLSLALVALSASAVLGCNRLYSEYTYEDGLLTLRVENSCSLNGFDFVVTCCGASGCTDAELERADVALGPNGRAFAMGDKDYAYVSGNRVTGGSRIKDHPKVSLFFPESCHTAIEGDASVPPCQFPQFNFQTLVTVAVECPDPADTVMVNGVNKPNEIVDLATSRATSGTM